MEAVRERARALGRPIAPIPGPPEVPRPAPVVPAPAVDTENRPPETDAAAQPAHDQPLQVATDAAARPEAEPDSGAAPEGTMIVPVAAWDKMLMQLGNLHEAGQQLAEARERAAKAETEATFLRERLGEIRRELAARGASDEEATRVTSVDEPDGSAPEPGATDDPADEERAAAPPAQTEKLWRYIYRGWRARRRP